MITLLISAQPSSDTLNFCLFSGAPLLPSGLSENQP